MTYASAGQHDDVFGLLQQPHRIIDGIILWELRTSRELARDRDREERVVGLVRGTFEERRGLDAERCAQLLRSDRLLCDGLFDERSLADFMEALSVRDSLLQSTGIGDYRYSSAAQSAGGALPWAAHSERAPGKVFV